MSTLNKHLLSGQNVTTDIVKDKDDGSFRELDTIILHYTAGGTTSSAVKTLKDPSVKSCAHVVVGRAGEMTQLIPFNLITWHAGESKWQNRVGMNKYSIGIEIVNWGPLDDLGGKFTSWTGTKISDADVKRAVHRNESITRCWHTYTEVQIKTVISLCKLLKATYGIKYILGHEEISPGRKQDPGPAFPLDHIRSLILDTNRKDVSSFPKVGIVDVDKLNIRVSPNSESPIISTPLVERTKLDIIGQQGDWYEVSIIGYVNKNYIKVV